MAFPVTLCPIKLSVKAFTAPFEGLGSSALHRYTRNVSVRLFDTKAIRAALKDFQADFSTINTSLLMKRESVSDAMVDQIVEAYVFLNELLGKGMDLFTPAGIHSLLEVNHTVLCGSDPNQRMSYYHHIIETRNRFTKRIKPIRIWMNKNKEKLNPLKLAAGFYSMNLSQPQLFIEGNHRTGNILVNYMLVSKGAAPYIVTPATALEYLNVSGEIKFTDKDNSLENTLKMPGQKKKFIALLNEHADERFLQD